MTTLETASNFDLAPLSATLDDAVTEADKLDFVEIQAALAELRAGNTVLLPLLPLCSHTQRLQEAGGRFSS